MKSLIQYIKENYSDEEREHLIDSIADRKHFLTFSNKDEDIWYNKLNLEERELILMQAGFTGLIDRDELEENGTIYYPVEKDLFWGYLEDDVNNFIEGNELDDSVRWTFGYKDGSTKDFSASDNELNIPELGTSQSKSKLSSIFNKCINIQKLVYILHTDGYGEPFYWCKNELGKKLLKEYGKFEEWNNGRGELKRDYVQDDWI